MTPEPTEEPEPTVTPEPTEEPTEDFTDDTDVATVRNSLLRASSNQLSDYLDLSKPASGPYPNTGFEMSITDDAGFDVNNPVADNGYFGFTIYLKESGTNQFPVGQKLYYQLPAQVTGYEAESGDIIGRISGDAEDVKFGTYHFEGTNLVVEFTDQVDRASNCTGSIYFWLKFDKSQIRDETEVDLEFPGGSKVTIYVKHDVNVSVRKTASSFDTETGTFTFTLDVEADGNATNVGLKDVMGSNLALDTNSFTVTKGGTPLTAGVDYIISNASDSGFEMLFPTLAAGDKVAVTYQAAIPEDILKNSNGLISNTDNTVYVSENNEDKFTVTGNASYTHTWIKKTNSGVNQDGTITWKVTVNPNADVNVKGETLSDTLRSDYLSFDLSSKITVNKYTRAQDGTLTKTGSIELDWSQVTLDSDGRGWSYTMNDSFFSDKAAYEFVYKTTYTVPEGGEGTEYSFENIAKVHGYTDSSSATVPATTTRITDKKFVADEQAAADGYAKWESKIYVPEGIVNSVVYKDYLAGNHTLPADLSLTGTGYDKVTVEGFTGDSGYPKLNRTDDTSFVIDFGKVTGPQTITVTYYTKIFDEGGNISNIGVAVEDGYSQSGWDETTIEKGNIGKSGQYDSSDRSITWTVDLGEGFANPVNITDSFSDNMHYVDGSAVLYRNNTPVSVSAVNKGSANGFVTIAFENVQAWYTAGVNWRLQYKTQLNEDIADAAGLECENQVEVRGTDGSYIGGNKFTVTVPSTVGSKAQIVEPNDENDYTATFQLLLNEEGKVYPPNANSYKVTDTLGSNMAMKQENGNDVVRVYKLENGQYNLVPTTDYTYSRNTLDDGRRQFTIEIDNTNGATYKVEYEVVIFRSSESDEDIVTVPYENKAEFVIGTKTIEVTYRDEVNIKKGSGGSMQGSRIYIYINKTDATNDNTRLDGAKFEVYEGSEASGTPIATKTITTENHYLGENPDLNKGPVSESGDFVMEVGKTYTIKEIEAPTGYKLLDEPITFTVTETFQPGTEYVLAHNALKVPNEKVTTIAAYKVWDDDNNRDGLRDDDTTITLELRADNVKVAGVGEVILSKSDTVTIDGVTHEWGVIWKDLPVYTQDGNTWREIVYTVVETKITTGGKEISVNNSSTGYYYTPTKDKDKNGKPVFVVTNKHNPATVNLTVKKQWDDGNNQDGKRPTSIKVKLTATVNGTAIDPIKNIAGNDVTNPVTLPRNNSWQVTWNNLPKYQNGQEIVYKVEEINRDTNSEYTVTYDNDEDGVFDDADGTYVSGKNTVTIKNSYIPKKTSVTVNKLWEAGDTLKPASVTVQLKKQLEGSSDVSNVGDAVTLNGDNNWSKTWSDLPVYEGGKKITYSVVETDVPGYIATMSNPSGAAGETTAWVFNITNKAENKKINVSVKKAWNDGGNQDGLRDKMTGITVTLKKSVKNGDSYGAYTDVDTYTVPQAELKTDWEHTWENLDKHAYGALVRYMVVEEIDYVDGETRTFTTTYASTAAAGTSERDNIYVTGDTTANPLITITNTYLTESTSVTVKKVWDDSGNQDGLRNSIEKITLQLQRSVYDQAKGDYTALADVTDSSINITGNEILTEWVKTFSNLPKNYNGHPIRYSVTETITRKSGETRSYTYTKDPEYVTGETAAPEITITNKYTTEKISVKAEKVWNDNENQDGLRDSVEGITLTLQKSVQVNGTYSDDYTQVGEVYTVPTTELKDPWDKTWDNLAKYENGALVRYRVVEDITYKNGEKRSYTKTYNGSAQTFVTGATDKPVITITNTYNSEGIDVTAKKIWDDSGNQDGLRAGIVSITVQLQESRYNNGAYGELTDVAGKTETITGTAIGTDWQVEFKGLDKYANQQLIKYAVKETVTYAGGETRRYASPVYAPQSVTGADQSTEIKITNSYTTEKTSVTAQKEWNDNGNQDGLRNSVTAIELTLKKAVYNGSAYGGYENVETYNVPSDKLDEPWSKKWDNLDKYANGQLIRYKVEEKITYETTESRRFTVTYNGLPYESEDAFVTGAVQTPTITIANSYSPNGISVTAKKFWDDGNDRDGLRKNIASITFALRSRQAGTAAWSPVESAVFEGADAQSDNISKTWSNLPEFTNGVRMEYSVLETVTYVQGTADEAKYEAAQYSQQAVTGLSEDKTITVTNRHTPETVSAVVKKLWEDANDQDGYRPSELKVQLMKVVDNNGTPEKVLVTAFPNASDTSTITLNAANNWSGGWEKLYKYENGVEIQYAVVELNNFTHNDKYTETTSADNNPVYKDGEYSFTLENTHEVDLKDLTVAKVWEDNDNALQIRPVQVEVRLLADGVPVSDYTVDEDDGTGNLVPVTYTGTVVLNEANDWSYEWKSLPVNNDKASDTEATTAIKYTVEETTRFDADTYTVSYNYDTNKEETWSLCEVVNTLETDKTSVSLLKFWQDNSSSQRPSTAKFQLYRQVWDETANAYGTKEKVGNAVTLSGSSNKALWRYTWTDLDRIANGKEILYSVEEVEVPDGYQVLVSGENNIFTMDNIFTRVEVSKKSITGSDELPGAKLELYDKEELEQNPQAEPVVSWTSTDTPKMIENLEIGKTYVLVETTAPDGYTVAESIEFEVQPTGTIQKVVMRDAPTSVEVSKKALTGRSELPNAVLQIVDENGNVAKDLNGAEAKWTTTTAPTVITGLKAGKYTLQEITPPTGYSLAADIEFEITAEGEVLVDELPVDVVTMLDAPIKVYVSKQNIGQTELVGAKFQILDAATDAEIDSWTSNGSRHEVAADKLEIGRSYILKETAAPDGYTLAEPVTFTIDEQGQVLVGGEAVPDNIITVVDVKRRISFAKLDATVAQIPDTRAVPYVAGAYLEVRYNVNGQPGNLAVTADGEVMSWVSEDQPTVFEGMKPGEYFLIETQAPDGYTVAAMVPFSVEVGNTVEEDNEPITITMEDMPTVFSVSKQEIAGITEITGATLQILDSRGDVAETIYGETLEWVTSPAAEIITGLKAGNYTLHEKSAPQGYGLAADIPFTLTTEGKILVNGDEVAENHLRMIDTKTKAEISKKALTGENELPGAKLAVLDPSDNNRVIASWTSSLVPEVLEEGILTVGKEYILRETEAPAGYLIADDVAFTVNSDGSLTKVTMRDAPIEVRISKQDADGTELKGAEFQILDGNNVIDTWVSDGSSHLVPVTAGLVTGKEYTLKETSAPDGYTLAAPVTFTVSEAGEVLVNEEPAEDNTIVVVDQLRKVSFAKIDGFKTTEDNTVYAADAQLEVHYNDNGEVGDLVTALDGKVMKWTSTDAPMVFNGIKAGDYYLVETAAPSGYLVAANVPFTITPGESAEADNEPITITMTDMPTEFNISKKDITGAEELEGALLQILDKDGNVAVTIYNEKAEWTSGTAPKTLTGLPAGTYTLHEEAAPDGYSFAQDIAFELTNAGEVIVNQEEAEELIMTDTLNSVEISKKTLTGEDELVGAKLQVIDKETSEVIDSWTSEETPHVISGIIGEGEDAKKLIAGRTYILQELEAPQGYWLADDIEFTIDKYGNTPAVTMRDTPTEVSILKVDENGIGLMGANLAVKDSTGTIVDQWTSNGDPHPIYNLIAGAEYTLTEVNAPAGYKLAEDMKFVVSEDDEVIEVVMEDEPEREALGKLSVTKKISLITDVDSTVDLIAKDAVFYVGLFRDSEGTLPYGEIKAIHLENASSGTAVFENLPSGTYYVLETDSHGQPIPLNELQVDDNGKQFMCIVDNGTLNSATLDLTAGDVEGKVNLNNLYYDLPDGDSYRAHIDISKQVLRGESEITVDDTFYAGIFTRDSTGTYELYKLVQLEQNGTVQVEVGLGGPDGDQPITYYVFECDENGDPVNLDTFEYEVSGEGRVTLTKDENAGKIDIVNELPVETQYAKLAVKKVDDNKYGLSGATFSMTDEDGEVVEEWTSEASAYIMELIPGEYTLKELNAPEGYIGGDEVAIIVGEDNSISVETSAEVTFENNVLTYVNKRETVTPTPPGSSTTTTTSTTKNPGSTVKSVKTGDDTPIALYVLLLAAAAIVGGAGAYTVRKRRKNQG